MSNEKQQRAKFSGSFGYILAVAGSAVGLGNIWRFPYLAAKYGGGMFLLTYLILTVTFGYALIVSETSLGRKTKQGPVGAFAYFGKGKGFKFGGWINAIIPMLIVPYYSAIGGWVVKYLVEYIKGNAGLLAQDGYFTDFLGQPASMEICFVVFALVTFLVIVGGVKNGIERASKIMMPILVVLAVVVAIYSVTRPGAIEGVKFLLIPNFENFSLMTVVAAMGQMFYSLSIAMGILYTYGSYLKEDVDIEKSTGQIEIFDTAIAILAALMIIPAVFAFSGGAPESLNAGPSLMFITLPKVFDSMGMGNIIGFVFFLMVFFAALTSSISLLETCAATLTDLWGISRKKASFIMLAEMLVIGTACVLGFNLWDFVLLLGMGILDFLDFLTNSVMMPISAFATCILIVKIIGTKAVAEEVKKSSAFKREKMYNVVIKYIAPVCLIIILLSSIANVFGWISI